MDGCVVPSRQEHERARELRVIGVREELDLVMATIDTQWLGRSGHRREGGGARMALQCVGDGR